MSKDHSGLVSVARALWGLQSVYGDIPNTLAQGRSVRKLLNMVAMFNLQFGQPPTKQVSFKLPDIPGQCCLWRHTQHPGPGQIGPQAAQHGCHVQPSVRPSRPPSRLAQITRYSGTVLSMETYPTPWPRADRSAEPKIYLL